MAVLGKIRQRSGILLIVIALATLAFIFGGIFENGGIFNTDNSIVGSVNGKDVPAEQFRIKVDQAIQQQRQQGRGPISQTQAANQVWDQEVNLALLNEELEKLGIRVGKSHIENFFKNNQNFSSNPSFQDATGKFSLEKMQAFFNTSSEQRKYLKQIEDEAVTNLKYQMYSNLLKGGYFVTKADAEFKYKLQNDKITFDFVQIPFSSIKDTDVKVSDEEITAYMNKNEKKYKAEETRELEYIIIEDKPSEADKNEIKKEIELVLNGDGTTESFKTTTNVADFVSKNSEIPYDSTYYAKQDFPAEVADILYNLPAGQFHGPYIMGEYYAVSKAMGKKANAKARASHILISYTGSKANPKEPRTKEEAQAKANELLAQVNANPNMLTMLAFQFSDDQGSAQQGGDLNFFPPAPAQGAMVKPFNDFVFNNAIGKVGVVESEFGFHIIKVTDKQDAIRLATIAKKISASEESSDLAYNKATQFEMDANEKTFEAAIKNAKLTALPTVKVKINEEGVGQLGSQRQIVRWAFEDKTDENSVKNFDIANVGYAIVRLKKTYKEGLLNLEDARAQIEPILKNKKKAEKIMDSIKGTSLSAIATANKTTVQNAAGISIESPSIATGYEPKVVGTAFSTTVNKISKPIEGTTGVYVVQTKSIAKAVAVKSYKDQITALNQEAGNAVNRVFTALKDKADIEDKRYNQSF
jgi:peptidyl-prolyl cis-trans isomerase D